MQQIAPLPWLIDKVADRWNEWLRSASRDGNTLDERCGHTPQSVTSPLLTSPHLSSPLLTRRHYNSSSSDIE